MEGGAGGTRAEGDCSRAAAVCCQAHTFLAAEAWGFSYKSEEPRRTPGMPSSRGCQPRRRRTHLRQPGSLGRSAEKLLA
ncbi:hypothetical protein V5799_032713, partial [Amblyomma americanum]